MPYDDIISAAWRTIQGEGRDRVFANLVRHQGGYPRADIFEDQQTRPITVWCSNDYLGMGQHPKVLSAMYQALDAVDADSGGTRNISDTARYHVELEHEIASLHQRSALWSECPELADLQSGPAAE